MLHAGLPHLAQGAIIRDQKAVTPERMVEPVAFERVQVHADAQLTHGDFLQHEPVHSQGRIWPECYARALPQANDAVHIRCEPPAFAAWWGIRKSPTVTTDTFLPDRAALAFWS